MNSKLDFREKRQSFDGKKAKVKYNEKHITRHKQTRMRSETHRKLLFYLDFHSYFEAATGPNYFIVFWKILLQSIFQARIISWSLKQAQMYWVKLNNTDLKLRWTVRWRAATGNKKLPDFGLISIYFSRPTWRRLHVATVRRLSAACLENVSFLFVFSSSKHLYFNRIPL